MSEVVRRLGYPAASELIQSAHCPTCGVGHQRGSRSYEFHIERGWTACATCGGPVSIGARRCWDCVYPGTRSSAVNDRSHVAERDRQMAAANAAAIARHRDQVMAAAADVDAYTAGFAAGILMRRVA